MFEQRRGKRFEVDWIARIDVKPAGEHLVDSATVCNISSTGALLKVNRSLRAGERIEVFVKLPMRKDNWMRYSAEVIRETIDGGVKLVAIKFDEPTPEFRPAAPEVSP